MFWFWLVLWTRTSHLSWHFDTFSLCAPFPSYLTRSWLTFSKLINQVVPVQTVSCLLPSWLTLQFSRWWSLNGEVKYYQEADLLKSENIPHNREYVDSVKLSTAAQSVETAVIMWMKLIRQNLLWGTQTPSSRRLLPLSPLQHSLLLGEGNILDTKAERYAKKKFLFHWKKYKNDDHVIFVGVCTKQSCSLTSGEYDL